MTLMNVYGGLIQWVTSLFFFYLTALRVLMNGSTQMKLFKYCSNTKLCVVTSVVFSFTNDMSVYSSNVKLLKYADDMALVGISTENNTTQEEAYFSQVTIFEDWCQTSNLEFNVAKTK